MPATSKVGFDALVLAGGAGRRLGGIDKASIRVGGRTLFDRAVVVCADATRVIVVGPRRAASRPVLWVREQPAGAGPVAALAAGLPLVVAEIVVVLAVDMPFMTAGTLDRLVDAAAVGGVDGALLVGADGRDQPLAGAYRRSALAGRLAELGPPAGLAVRTLLAPLDCRRLPDEAAATMDCDTWDQLELARLRAHNEGELSDEPAG